MGLRVLVADHSENISKSIELSLKDMEAQVKLYNPKGVMVPSFEDDILKQAKSFHPDIIFLDTLLSKTSGYDICRVIKSDEQFESVPVILMYNSIIGIDSEKLKSSKAQATLEKPFTPKQVHSVATDVLQPEEIPLEQMDEDIELPPDMAQQIQPSFQSHTDQSQISQNQPEQPKIPQNSNQIKVPKKSEGFVHSASELEALQKSLSESQEEEEFQQVSLDQVSSPEKDTDTPTQEPSKDLSELDLSSIKQPSLDFTADFSSTTLLKTDEKSLTKPQTLTPVTKKLESNIQQASSQKQTTQTKTEKADNMQLDEKKIDLNLKTQVSDAISDQTASKDQQVNKAPKNFQLDIPDDAIHKDNSMDIAEPEEEMTPIQFLTTPVEKYSDKEKGQKDVAQTTNITQGNISQDKNEDQKDVAQTTEEQIENPNFQDQIIHALSSHKDLKSILQEAISNNKLFDSSQKDLQAIIQEEIRKMVQDHLHRYLRDDLPNMAKKLVQEEIDRLLSEHPS